jgi:flagellum-specific peptidoglycan hydrolase FlgJ
MSGTPKAKDPFDGIDMPTLLKNGQLSASLGGTGSPMRSWSGDGEIMADFDPSGRVYANEYEHQNRNLNESTAPSPIDPNMQTVVVTGKRGGDQGPLYLDESEVQRENYLLAQRTHTVSSMSSSGMLSQNGKNYFLIQRDANGLGIYQNSDITTSGSYELTQPSSTPPEAATGGWSQIGRLSAGLKVGSNGTQVAELQRLLGIEADGTYGPRTEQALKASFVAATYTSAQASESSTGIPAAITTAQAILESNYGKSIPTDVNNGTYSYNIFGIKAGSGQDFVTSWTHEVTNGISQRVLGNFAAYDSFEESLDAHSTFLTTNRRYQSLFDSRDPTVWANGLQAKGYATDPQYATKLISVMNKWNLK